MPRRTDKQSPLLISLIVWLLSNYPVASFGKDHQLKEAIFSQKSPAIEVVDKFLYPNKNLQKNPFHTELNEPSIKAEKFLTGQAENKRISLSFKEIKVKTVLQLLAEFTGNNIIISDTVSGNITLHFDDIPWEYALDSILTTRSLAKREINGIMLIAPIDEIIEHKIREFKAQEDLTALVPLQSDLIQINYAKAADIAGLLQDKNAGFMSARGSLGVDKRTNMLWIQDNAAQLLKLKEFIRQLDIPAQQVLIEARLVNVTRDFARDLGIHFAASKASHVDNSSNALVPDAPLADRLNIDLAALPSLAGASTSTFALATLAEGILLDLELSAIESEGRGEIISSPRLITTSQKEAIIESGEEIPYQEFTVSGGTSTAFKKAVLSLKVIPQITAENKILMDLHINQDTLSPRAFNGVPSVLTKEIRTRVLVDNGQTIVLGGIYKQDKNKRFNRVPFFHGVPVLGSLFKNQSLAMRNEELLIFITPRIIASNLPLSAIKGRMLH